MRLIPGAVHRATFTIRRERDELSGYVNVYEVPGAASYWPSRWLTVDARTGQRYHDSAEEAMGYALMHCGYGAPTFPYDSTYN